MSQPTTLHDQRVPVKLTLAAMWTSLMFLYVYVDILNFFTPGVLDEIHAGKVFTFDITQTFSVSALTLMSVPILMIALSATLPPRANRVANLTVAALYVPVTVFNVLGESWMYFYGLGVVLELIVLAFIMRSAWTWPHATQRVAV